MEIKESSVKMTHALSEIPHWQLPYTQNHNNMNQLGTREQEIMFHIHSHCHKALPSLCTYGSLWKEIPYYTVFQCISTPNTVPQSAVNKQWHYVGVWLHTNQIQIQWITPQYNDHNVKFKPSLLWNSCPDRWHIFEHSTITQCHNPYTSYIIV